MPSPARGLLSNKAEELESDLGEREARGKKNFTYNASDDYVRFQLNLNAIAKKKPRLE
jgi:hypothetical protein